MASRPRHRELVVQRVEPDAEIRAFSRFPLAIQPEAELIEAPNPTSFFATAEIGDVQSVLEDFHKSRPDMREGNKNISNMLEFLSGELDEVSADWDLDQSMSLEAYRAQEVADCLIFMLAMATQLGLTFDQAELEMQTKEIFQDHHRHVSTEFWTKDHEDLYWNIFSHLQSDILWLQQGNWPERFDELNEEDQLLWKQRLSDSFTLAWSLHRLYGLNPTREMLDKIARNMDKYPAGRGFHKPSRKLGRYRKRTKAAFRKRNMNVQHFSTRYADTLPAELGRPLPHIVPSPLSESADLLR